MRQAAIVVLLLSSAVHAQQRGHEEADQAAKRLHAPKGLRLDLYAAEPDIVNPVAFTFDEKGRIFVVETHRLGTCTFDIRGHMGWVDDDLACRTVADREAMHRKYMGSQYETLTQSERVRLLEDRSGNGWIDHATTFAEGFDTPADGIAAGILTRKGDVWFAAVPNLWRLRDTAGTGKADVRDRLHTGFAVRMGYIGHDVHGLRFGPDGKIYFTMGDRGAHVEKDGKLLVDNSDSGCVMRCAQDGSGLEVFCTGLRNPQELVFDAFGNAWTDDNNCDAGDKARLTYLMEGGDCGWRVGFQQAPGRGPWMSEKLWELDVAKTAPSEVPPVAHIDHGPSGISFNGGVGLPAAYDGSFFLANFPGNILTWKVKPKGAGFEMTGLGVFVGDIWPSDVQIGNDGAVYILDWVNGWSMPNKGRIYRVYDPELSAGREVKEAKTLIAEGMEKRPAQELGALLAHRDQRVRQAAQFELADRKDAATLSKVAGDSPLLGRLHAIWGLGQIGQSAPLAGLLHDPEAEVRAQAAKVLGDLRAQAELLPLLKDESLRVRSFAATALGKLGRKDAVGPIFELLRENDDRDPWLRSAGVIALGRIGEAEGCLERAKDPLRSVRLASLLVLRRLGRAEVALFLEDPDPSIVLEAARAINDQPVNAAMPALAAKLGGGLPEVALTRAVNAAFRTGNAALLAEFAARKDPPEGARLEAIRALVDWEKPSGRDRILHIWRPLAPRDPKPAQEAIASLFGLAAPGGSGPLRVEELRALAAYRDERLPSMLLLAAGDSDPKVTKEAANLLKKVDVSSALGLLEKMAAEGPVPVRQAAIGSLGSMAGREPERLLAPLVQELEDGKLPPTLVLDVLEAAKGKPAFKDSLFRYEASRKKDDALAPWRETLEGGDAELGRRAFFDRPDASCSKCHIVNGKGGIVGPDLSKIGGQKTREYLLESILFPNKEIAQGYAQVVLRLRNDAVETGRIEQETDRELHLILPDGSRKVIAKVDVTARKVGLSAMPEDASKALSKRDLRDLVEFLANLK
ncbi:MAG TPA: PVC-type heme-binding CxxCH protein [Planctomycetota bacterium]|nr:PVC-type heme-binding CxxCH protein [Planctomycetota bacterium]